MNRSKFKFMTNSNAKERVITLDVEILEEVEEYLSVS